MSDELDPAEGSPRPKGEATGKPSHGRMDQGDSEPIGRPGLHHWRESTITEPGLDNRGGVFFAAIEMTRMPMILTDPSKPDNPIAFANKAFLDLTGYEESEILGRNCRFLQGAQTDRETVAELREAVEERRSVAVEILNYRRDGSHFWNAVFIGPVYDVNGKLQYFFASQLDVTRRRNTEQSFRQAQKMESIGQLTAGLAHDFNNLLQVVNGNLELLSGRIRDERTRRYVENARVAADRGAKLTRQLLAFARKTRLEPRPTDLSTLVNDFIEVLESATGKAAELHLSLRRSLPMVVIDPDQLEMALLNVVSNARDAMPDGGVITISTRPVELPPADDVVGGLYVAMEVSDEGQGMAPEVVERAVEPFFTTKEVGKGTGLGLAMVSGFVRQSRGRLEINSELGKGTTVRLLLPISRNSAEVQEPMGDPAAPPRVNDALGRSEHILVVDDSSEVLELARDILTSAGYRVTTAASGEDALKVFDTVHESDHIDLLFTDLIMPGGMNGLTLADGITERDGGVSILLTTGYSEELVLNGPRKRATDVLSKPYRRSELLDRVRQALNRRGGGGPRRKRSDFGPAEA